MMFYIVYTFVDFKLDKQLTGSYLTPVDPRRSVDAFQQLRMSIAENNECSIGLVHILNMMKVGEE